MKRTCYTSLLRISLFACVACLISIARVQACVNPDSSVICIVTYDTIFSEVEVRVTNMRLMSETPTRICTCALTGPFDIFTELRYVTFVDSGTHIPHVNFAPWDSSLAASTAWDNGTTLTDWAGYVAETINSGLSADAPVELLIRAGLPAGYTLSFLDSAVSTIWVGTDEFDESNNTLKAAHQGLRYLGSFPIEFNEPVAASYFETLDSTISAQIASSIQPLLLHDEFNIYPNPIMQEKFGMSYTLLQQSPIQISMYDVVGRRIAVLYEGMQGAGLHEAQFAVPESALAHPGIYLLQIEGSEATVSRKLIISP